jgi:hypothetical protein
VDLPFTRGHSTDSGRPGGAVSGDWRQTTDDFSEEYETLKKAIDCLLRLRNALWKEEEDLTEEVIKILRGHESEISELEQINIEADRLTAFNWQIMGYFAYEMH